MVLIKFACTKEKARGKVKQEQDNHEGHTQIM